MVKDNGFQEINYLPLVEKKEHVLIKWIMKAKQLLAASLQITAL